MLYGIITYTIKGEMIMDELILDVLKEISAKMDDLNREMREIKVRINDLNK